MKKLLSFLALVPTLIIATPVSAAGLSTYEDLYPLTGIVTEIEYKEGVDLVTMTCVNGNQFSWYADAEECWYINDLASCIMNSNGTKIVYDDEVVLAHYAGSLSQLAKYTAE